MTSDHLHLQKEAMKPRIRIKSNDPVGRGILEQFYDQCTEKEKEAELSPLERKFVNRIESAYLEEIEFEDEEVQSFFKEVYGILDQAEERSKKQEQIFNALSSVVLPGEHRGEHIDNYFDEIKKTVTAAKRLDFSLPAPLFEQEENGHNLLSYSSVSINTILETARYGMFSINVLNAISTHVEDTAFIATNTDGSIRTINSFGETLFGVNRYEAARSHIRDFIVGVESILENFYDGHRLNDWREVLIRSAETDRKSASLLLLETDNKGLEMKELVFVVQLTSPYDLRLNRAIHIKMLQGILGAAQSLKSSVGSENPFINMIEEYSWNLRKMLQGSLEELLLKAPEGCDSIHLTKLLNDVMKDLIEGNPEVEINTSNNYTGDFLAVPADIEQMLMLLTDIGCLYDGAKYKPS